MGVIGVAKNGVLIQSWASAGCCDVGEEELEELDSCNGHPVADSGRYHYHLWPRCLQSCENGVGGTQAGFIGVALDGFPIYGPQDVDGNTLARGDLDECNGKLEVLPNGNNAGKLVYRYHIIDEFPWTLGCFRGDVSHLADQGLLNGQGACTVENMQTPCEDLNCNCNDQSSFAGSMFNCESNNSCSSARKRRSLKRSKRAISMVCDGTVGDNPGNPCWWLPEGSGRDACLAATDYDSSDFVEQYAEKDILA